MNQAPKEIAPFLRSLRKMLDEESNSILRWTSDGKAFEIHDFDAMSDYVLPKYFKHRKYASFQRQLNYFNFRKWTKSKAVVCTFSNPFFLRDQPDLAWHITRKKCPTSSIGSSSKSSSSSSSMWKQSPVTTAYARPSISPPPVMPAPSSTQAPPPAPQLQPSQPTVPLTIPSTSWHHVDDHFRIMVPGVDDFFLQDVCFNQDPPPMLLTHPETNVKTAFDSPHSVTDVPSSTCDINLLDWVDKAFPTLEMITILDQPSSFSSPWKLEALE